MRKFIIIISIAFQVLVLFYMAAEREMILITGKTIHLRTAPVDPNDPFRGDFVRLNYEISNIPSENLKGNLTKKENGESKKNIKVFSVLKQGDNGLFEIDYCTDQKPEKGIFIKGHTDSNWRFQGGKSIYVKYGIETYFVQEGKGFDIEKRAGNRSSIQIPLEMEIAIGKSGIGVVKGFRWSAIGVGLEILDFPKRRNFGWNSSQNQNQENKESDKNKPERKSVKIRLTLQNASDKPLAIVNLPDSRSFSLEPVVWAEKKWVPVKKFDTPIKPLNENVIVLKPEEKQSFDFDFSDERWFVQGDTSPSPIEIGAIENQWNNTFRIVYRPPSPEECGELKDKDLIWHGHISSRAFNGTGNID